MVQGIFTFEIAVNFRDKVPKYYIFWTGKHDWHMMDWAGCNFRRIQYPKNSFPTFETATDFAKWYQAGRDREASRAAIISNRKMHEKWKKPGQPSAPDSTWGASWNLDGNGTHTGEYGDRVYTKTRIVDRNITAEEFTERKHRAKNLLAGRDAWDDGCDKCGLSSDRCECE